MIDNGLVPISKGRHQVLSCAISLLLFTEIPSSIYGSKKYIREGLQCCVKSKSSSCFTVSWYGIEVVFPFLKSEFR